MDPNAGWFAVAGALAAGVPQVVSVVVQSSNERGQRKYDAEQAQVQRDADAAEAQARRDHEAAERQAAEVAQRRAQRRQTIDRWRAALAEGTEEERNWDVREYGDAIRPNLIGQPWFEEQRAYMSEAFSIETRVNATPETVGDLSRMIAHLEREWLRE